MSLTVEDGGCIDANLGCDETREPPINRLWTEVVNGEVVLLAEVQAYEGLEPEGRHDRCKRCCRFVSQRRIDAAQARPQRHVGPLDLEPRGSLHGGRHLAVL